ncbi:glutaredoxin-4 [Salmonella enterica subsp. enterica serovar Enteritidis str. 50-5646]|nr:glutaredoxin-4 [Salmonella enterica subsp. enterica serovar Enteritidis str. 50-5646]
MSTTIEKIQRQIAENPILLYMKGSPKLPSSWFFCAGRSGAFSLRGTFCLC